jgi:integrase/recombinase XerD
VDVRNRHVIVMGKGSKERILPFCARTGQAIWRYLAMRKDEAADRPLFLTEDDTPFDRHSLRKMLIRIGVRAGVKQVNVHRFRHTFAINYLRNGGDPYSLQRLMGHSTMEMVKHYLAIAQSDLERNHKLASPVDHWRL